MRSYYENNIKKFVDQPFDLIWSKLTAVEHGDVLQTQKMAWEEQITILKEQIKNYEGYVFFEYTVPCKGKRIDVVLLINGIVFVLEFKVGSKKYHTCDSNQVWDYALDLKYFHEESHNLSIIPILIATCAKENDIIIKEDDDQVIRPIRSNGNNLSEIIKRALTQFPGKVLDSHRWSISRYSPTPTIIEAAQALYQNHSVEEISRSDADNLSKTSDYIFQIIEEAKVNKNKAICFVTGVPGAGKTLVGLNISAQQHAEKKEMNAVYLSGNGPLVKILIEALTRDKKNKIKEQEEKCTKEKIKQEISSFIQNVHHFRDTCLDGTVFKNGEIVPDPEYYKEQKNCDKNYPPKNHIAIFDEAQRAWTKDKTADFMNRKKKKPGFPYSEPEFLISCMDRHQDWALIICLVGGGQEINTGEAGISEWIYALNNRFKDWHIHISPKLTDKEYASGMTPDLLKNRLNVCYSEELHLAVSNRSFRAENLALFIHHLLDLNAKEAKIILRELLQYPIVLTRDIEKAKKWLKSKARGSERYGMIVSSQASRLRALGIDIRVKTKPEHWFLSEKEDVRSSYRFEDVATEFDIQGLELDYTCVVWDGDFRYESNQWGTYSFKGNKWQSINKKERKMYLKNAYRVLLTRARQGMIIVVPEGDLEDSTRKPSYYDSTYHYLKSLGIDEI